MKKQPTSKHGSSHRDQIKMLPTDWYIYSSYMYHILHPTPSGLRSFLAWFPLDQHRPTMARHTTSSSGSPLPLPAEELYLISWSGGAQHFNMTKSKRCGQNSPYSSGKKYGNGQICPGIPTNPQHPAWRGLKGLTRPDLFFLHSVHLGALAILARPMDQKFQC